MLRSDRVCDYSPHHTLLPNLGCLRCAVVFLHNCWALGQVGPSLDAVISHCQRLLADTLSALGLWSPEATSPFSKGQTHSSQAWGQTAETQSIPNTISYLTLHLSHHMSHIPFPYVISSYMNQSKTHTWPTHYHLHDFLLIPWPDCLLLDLTGLTNISHLRHDPWDPELPENQIS